MTFPVTQEHLLTYNLLNQLLQSRVFEVFRFIAEKIKLVPFHQFHVQFREIETVEPKRYYGTLWCHITRLKFTFYPDDELM